MSVWVWGLLRSRCQKRIISDLLRGPTHKGKARRAGEGRGDQTMMTLWHSCRREGRRPGGKSFPSQWGSKKALTSLMWSSYASHPSRTSPVSVLITPAVLSDWEQPREACRQHKWGGRSRGHCWAIMAPHQAETWVFSRLPQYVQQNIDRDRPSNREAVSATRDSWKKESDGYKKAQSAEICEHS